MPYLKWVSKATTLKPSLDRVMTARCAACGVVTDEYALAPSREQPKAFP